MCVLFETTRREPSPESAMLLPRFSCHVCPCTVPTFTQVSMKTVLVSTGCNAIPVAELYSVVEVVIPDFASARAMGFCSIGSGVVGDVGNVGKVGKVGDNIGLVPRRNMVTVPAPEMPPHSDKSFDKARTILLEEKASVCPTQHPAPKSTCSISLHHPETNKFFPVGCGVGWDVYSSVSSEDGAFVSSGEGASEGKIIDGSAVEN
mmetsp:Transcript_25028/g.33184  ORF Transcript_25028/g.33184 Transcript_25028/m.33184 type:complete len:205 (-) Transcript_25028:1163-1777(-)